MVSEQEQPMHDPEAGADLGDPYAVPGHEHEAAEVRHDAEAEADASADEAEGELGGEGG